MQRKLEKDGEFIVNTPLHCALFRDGDILSWLINIICIHILRTHRARSKRKFALNYTLSFRHECPTTNALKSCRSSAMPHLFPLYNIRLALASRLVTILYANYYEIVWLFGQRIALLMQLR